MLAPNAFVRNRYLIVRVLGAGTGVVYEATDLITRTNVALKQIIVGEDAVAARREAFEREARRLTGLRHPALPIVGNYFAENDSEFLVSDFIPGDDLATTLQQRNGVPFAAGEVLRYADQLLGALDYMHSQWPPIIHLNIKPCNLKLTPRGQIMLLDFGMAQRGTVPVRTKPASAGQGSPLQFMPIEQVQGIGADERSDLFSLAATLYYLLTGVLPELAGKRANAVDKRKPDPLRPAHAVNEQVPAAVSDLLMQALALDPAARPASAAAMRAALEQARVAPLVAARRDLAPTIPFALVAPPPRRAQPPAAEQIPALLHVTAPAQQSDLPSPSAVPAAQPTRQRWLGPTIGVAAIALLLLAFFLLRQGSDTAALSITPSPATTSAPLRAAVTALAAAPTNEPSPAPSVAPAPISQAEPIASAFEPMQVTDVEPKIVFAGALPILLTVRGANLDHVRTAQLVADNGTTIPAEVQTRAVDQLKLSIPTLPAPITGAVTYTLQLDRNTQNALVITLRDYRERKAVQGVQPDYSFTNRVATDTAGAYTGMHAQPDAASAPVGRLRNGDQVDLLNDTVADWYQVRVSASGDAAQFGVIGWIERWLVDNQGAPAAPTPTPVPPTPDRLVFDGRVYSAPTDAAVQCGTAFESSIYGSVENSVGKGIAGAVLRIVSADRRNTYSATTARGGVYNVGGLGCTTWTVRLISIHGSAIQANTVTVKNLNGGRFTSAEVRFKLRK